jgi:hypothetical protein
MVISTTMPTHQCTPQLEFISNKLGQSIWRQTRGKLNIVYITSSLSKVLLMRIISRRCEPQLHIGDVPFALKFSTFHIS